MTVARSQELDCLQAEELVPGFLALMAAPPAEDAGVLLPRRLLGWGSLVGVILGVAAYLGSAAVQRPSSVPAPLLARPALAFPSAALTAPAASMGSEPAIDVVRSFEGADADQDTRALGSPAADSPSLVAVRHSYRKHLGTSGTQPMTRAYRTLLRQAWTRYGQGDLELAASLFGRAVHMDQRQTAGYYGLALALFEQGAEDAALHVLERGAARVGAKHDLWLLAGSIYQWKGREKAARAAYQRYLWADPRGAFARDVRVVLSYPQLPALLPFDGADTLEMLAAE